MLLRSPHWRCGDDGGGAYAYVALLVVLLLAGDATVTRGVQAAHSQKRVAVRTRVVHVYDRSITTFDPQGRLLQVEYGLEAANRGSPIVALITNETAYVGMLSSLSSSSSSSGGGTTSGGLSPTTTTTTTAIRPLHRLDDHLFLVTSGLAGDALALAAELRLAAVRHAWANGEPMTVRECATAAANVQHTLTKQAGARPLGITALVLGINGSSSSSNDNDTGPRLYRCHAGGSLQDVWYAAAGKNERAAMKKLQQAYATIQAAAQEDSSTNEQFIVQTIVSALKAATEDKRDKQSFDVWIMRPQKGTHPTATTATNSVACIQGLTNSVSKKDLQKTLESLQVALQ